jgi:hypothetical protein
MIENIYNDLVDGELIRFLAKKYKLSIPTIYKRLYEKYGKEHIQEISKRNGAKKRVETRRKNNDIWCSEKTKKQISKTLSTEEHKKRAKKLYLKNFASKSHTPKARKKAVETRKKNNEKNGRSWWSDETIKKMSDTKIGKKFTDEHKKNLRLSVIKRKENRCGQISPNYNPKSISKIEEEAKKYSIIDLQHAETLDGEFYIRELGYWVDGYSKEKNIVIEYDEPRHYKNGKLKEKDIQRQKEIEKYLGCKFIRIKFRKK